MSHQDVTSQFLQIYNKFVWILTCIAAYLCVYVTLDALREAMKML